MINILRGTDECETGKPFTAEGITKERKGYPSALQQSKLGKLLCDFLCLSYTLSYMLPKHCKT